MLCAEMRDAKRTILARRAEFLTAALAGIACTPSSTPVEPAAQSIVIPPLGDADVPVTASSAEPAPVDVGDRDGDGVLDVDDACPDQPGPRSTISRDNGCPKVIVSVCLSIVMPPKVTFATNSVAPSSTSPIDYIAQTILGNPQIKVEIEGHTDNSEPPALGQQRADAVKLLLVKRGVAQTRMTTSNASSTKPIATNTTDAGRAKNRRVELIVR